MLDPFAFLLVIIERQLKCKYLLRYLSLVRHYFQNFAYSLAIYGRKLKQKQVICRYYPGPLG